MSYHAYCPLLTKQGKPSSQGWCDAYYVRYMQQIVKGDLKKLQSAGFLTEWGALEDADTVDREQGSLVPSHEGSTKALLRLY